VKPEPIKILIVDDSRIFRGLLADALARADEVEIVGSVWNGVKALEFIRSSPPDLVTLDIEMPLMGGLEALQAIREFNQSRPDAPPVGVLLLSSFTRQGAAVTVAGLEAGAFDFLSKPVGGDAAENLATLRQQLLFKVKQFAASRRPRAHRAGPTDTFEPAAVAVPAGRPKELSGRVEAILIAASTGGPEALAQMLPALPAPITTPIFIVQHMPPQFTELFASSLARRSGRAVIEARDQGMVRPGGVYLAPGGKHLLVRASDGEVYTMLSDQPAENGCRPAADVLFRSAALVYPNAALAIVLTGMGSDGAKGLAALKRSGAYVIAQDEATSVVWGMPGSAVSAGLVDQVLPLMQIAPTVAAIVAGE